MRAVSRPPVVVGVIAAAVAAACGRIGYDDLDVDAAVPIDFTETPCDTPVKIVNLGASVTPAPAATAYALDVAATATGLVAAWNVGGNEVQVTGVAVDSAGRVGLLQPAACVLETPSTALAAAAIDDDVILAIDDGGQIQLHDLDGHGYQRGDVAYLDTKRGFGHEFITADPARDHFVVVGTNGTATYALTVDHDGDELTAPGAVLPAATEVPEGVAVALRGADYAVMSGTSGQCELRTVDASFAPVSAPRQVAMTCHHASVVTPPGSANVLGAWNCDNDSVWVVAGDPTITLPAERAVFGDSSMSASNPRVVVTSAGVWYAYQVVGGRLGRALLGADGNPVSGGEPVDAHQSAQLVAYDLVARADRAFLVWIESGSEDDLWAMRLCAP